MFDYFFAGLAYKHKVGGSHHQLKDEFPGLEEQIQLSDILDNEKMHQFFRQHFRAFLHYLEDSNPALSYHTEYMQKMHKHILKVMKVLDKCGYERLISICHGDAKPNNFMFRNICIGKKHAEKKISDDINFVKLKVIYMPQRNRSSSHKILAVLSFQLC